MSRSVMSGCALSLILSLAPAARSFGQQPESATRWDTQVYSVDPIRRVHYTTYQENSGMTLTPADEALRAHLKLAMNEGLIVTALEPNSPAASAGIRQNDVLIRLGDDASHAVAVARRQDLEDALKKSGDQPVSVILLRSGKQIRLKVQPRIHASLGPVRPEPPAYWIGVSVGPVEPALRAQLQLTEKPGLLALSVDPNGPASKAGVHPFDILMKLDGVDLSDQADLIKLVQSRGEKTVPLELIREGHKQEITITPARRDRVTLEVYYRSLSNAPKTETVDVVLPARELRSKTETLDVVLQAQEVRWRKHAQPADPAARPETSDQTTAKRLDELAKQVKELRQAIETLTKAQQKK